MFDFAEYLGLIALTLIALVVGRNIGIGIATKRLVNRQLKVIEREALLKNIGKVVRDLGSDKATLPSLVRWSEQIQAERDALEEGLLLLKKRPAPGAREKVREANRKARDYQKVVNTLRNQIDLYESLAPWLREYTELTVEEVLEGLSSTNDTQSDDNENPARRFLTRIEWDSLSDQDKLQRSLDNYLDPNRKKSLWQIGIDFERYIGYTFEKLGYKVIFHGAKHGMEDLGIDLICQKDQKIAVVQCKRLSAIKEIPVRENTVAQIYGAAIFYGLKERIPKRTRIQPMLITSYILSDQAKEFAEHLGVEVQENVLMEPYPVIKCNINPQTSEKIFHLPFDQQYDSIVIGDVKGEFYASSVSEAVSKGFRHAYRWNARPAR